MQDPLARLPHAGKMRLLSRVLECTPTHVQAEATSHLDPDNPLRSEGKLSAVHAIEYAAQATAAHGAAFPGTCAEPPPLRLLGAVRAARFERDRLDDLGGPLTIEARLVQQTPEAASYAVRVACLEKPVMEAQLLLVNARQPAR
jgi:predicted hotdog family 3-hydroxylacyl-ACP dehydratase